MSSALPPASIETLALRGGEMWSRRMRRGQVLRLTDPSGRAAVAALFYNADAPLERYNMPDTLKAQYTAFLTAGRVLYSDMGRVLASIVEDTCGWHDTLSGCGDAADARARFGQTGDQTGAQAGDPGGYQALRNARHRNTRDNFLVELGKHGLGKRDIVANVNFFVRVTVGDDGRMSWVPHHSRPGAHVDLRFEMNTLVILSNTPHPLDPAATYAPPAVELAIREGRPAGADDLCRTSRPENERGFALTESYLRQWTVAGS